MKLELKEGTTVVTPGGEEVGKINRFVLDPETNEVTHMVVQKGWLFTEDKVVPLEMVDSATNEKVVLLETTGNFEQFPPFEERHFVRAIEEPDSPGSEPVYHHTQAYYWYPPYGYVGSPIGYYGWPPVTTERNIPENTVALKEGADVMSSDDKHVGDVERLFIEPGSNRASHFLISQGLLFKDRKLVPAHWVRTVAEDKIHLAVSAKMLESLPSYEAD